MTAQLILAAGTQGPTTELTGTSVYFRWQYELILYALVIGFLALFAAGVYGMATRQEVSKKYRTAALASTLICWIATLAYLALVIVWLTKFRSNGDGTMYSPRPGTIFTGLRYADWSVTVPLLTVELLAVCTVARDKIIGLRFSTMAAAFLMIVTGFLGVIAVAQGHASTAELIVWGAISTVFFVALYPLLLRPVFATVKSVTPEAGTSLRNAAVLLLSVWGVYPLVYLIALWAGDNSPGWATTTQLAFTAADIVAKAGFGVLIHKVAKLRTAEDARAEALAVPDTYPTEVYMSGHLLALPALPGLTDARAAADLSSGHVGTSAAGPARTGRHDRARDTDVRDPRTP